MGDIYMVGGWDNKNLDRYDPKRKTFKTINSLKTGRCNFGICKYDDCSFMIAGGDDDYYVIKTSFVYNINSNKFKEVGNLKTKRHGHVLVNCMDNIYAIGGAKDIGGANDDCLKTIEVFDKSTKLWRLIKSKLVTPRFYHCAAAHKHFVFVVGGMQRDYLITSSIEKFDTSTGRVEIIKTKLRVPRCHFALTKFEKSVFIIGGRINSNKIDANEKDTNKIDSNNKDSNRQDSNSKDLYRIDSNNIDSNIVDSNIVDSNKVDSKKLYSNKHVDEFTDSVEILNLKSEKLYRGKNIPFKDQSFSSCSL